MAAGLGALAGGDTATLQALAALSAAQQQAASAQVSTLQGALPGAVPTDLSSALGVQMLQPPVATASAVPGAPASTADRGTIDIMTAAGLLAPAQASIVAALS